MYVYAVWITFPRKQQSGFLYKTVGYCNIIQTPSSKLIYLLTTLLKFKINVDKKYIKIKASSQSPNKKQQFFILYQFITITIRYCQNAYQFDLQLKSKQTTYTVFTCKFCNKKRLQKAYCKEGKHSQYGGLCAVWYAIGTRSNHEQSARRSVVAQYTQ